MADNGVPRGREVRLHQRHHGPLGGGVDSQLQAQLDRIERRQKAMAKVLFVLAHGNERLSRAKWSRLWKECE